MRIGIGNDHTAVEYKQAITQHIRDTYGYEVVNYGTDQPESYDYPIAGETVANAVAKGEVDLGIVICGTGIGISLAANKIPGIRAVVCGDVFTAKATREHNDANILAMGGRVVGPGLALMIVDTFLDTPFSGAERHVRRLQMIDDIEV